MRTLTAYSLGDDYSFAPPSPGAQRVTVVLRDGFEVRRDRTGAMQVFPEGTPSGFTLATAVVLNWCTVLEAPAED